MSAWMQSKFKEKGVKLKSTKKAKSKNKNPKPKARKAATKNLSKY